MKSLDEKFMAQALKLARLGGRDVAPNPMVGAVIVKNLPGRQAGGKVIGSGYHKKFGGPHAEVNAIKSVYNKSDLHGAIIYVTLEPCRHYGKTPPCLGMIRSYGFKRVICGSHDLFQQKFETRNPKFKITPKSETRNLKQLWNSKLEIVFLKGVIAKQCKELNKFFFTWVEKKRPFVTVKVAMSADGFVAGLNGESVRFTSTKQDKEVHVMRAMHQAIMVGVNTVLNDDPSLTVRHVKGQDPLRVILDSKLRIPKGAKVLKDENYLVATTVANPNDQTLPTSRQVPMTNLWKSPTKDRVSLKKLLQHLADIGISSVLVEPGPTLYKSLKKQGLIDELVVYRSKKKLRSGLKIEL